MIDPRPVIDIGTALDLLTSVVTLRGRRHVYRPAPASTSNSRICVYAHDGAPHCIVGYALALACGGVEELEALGEEPIRQLYEEDRLPVRLTPGALVVFDAAQRRQDQRAEWADVLAHAMSVARRFAELLTADALADAPGAQGRRGRTQRS